VLVYNPQTRKMELQPIVHVWLNQDNDLVDLTITTPATGQHGTSSTSKSEVIHTNQKHPFLTVEHGFLPVGQIKVGMHVVRADGRMGVITKWTIVPGVKMIYNLEVAQDHTFTVGDGQWIVHNCNPSDLVNPTARTYAQKMINAFTDHLTSSDLEGAWRDLHGDPVPKPAGGFYNHLQEVEEALGSGKRAIQGFTKLLNSGILSEEDRCIVQCLISGVSKTMDYTEKIITRDVWFPGTQLPFP